MKFSTSVMVAVFTVFTSAAIAIPIPCAGCNWGKNDIVKFDNPSSPSGSLPAPLTSSTALPSATAARQDVDTADRAGCSWPRANDTTSAVVPTTVAAGRDVDVADCPGCVWPGANIATAALASAATPAGRRDVDGTDCAGCAWSGADTMPSAAEALVRMA